MAKTKEFYKKIVVLGLVFVFAFQPLAPAFAQTDEPVVEPVEVIDEPVVLEVVEDVAPSVEAQPAEETPALAEAQAATQGSTETQPASPVSQLTQKLPEIDKNTGALNYSFPISVPSGRNNLQPQIGLSYNSGLSGQNSAFGYGWAVSIPYIQRLNKTGTDALYTSNYFYSSLDGELTRLTSTSYTAKTENGSFNKYTFQNNQWVVILKDGTQYKFGSDALSQQNDLSNPSNVYKWMLQETRDANNNYISYAYFKDAGQIYPLSVKYTGNGTTDGIFEVNFSTETRPDISTNYSTGFSVTTNYRINEITTSVSSNWVNKYSLSYVANQNANKSLVNSITMSGKDSSGIISTLPATTYDYESSDYNWNTLSDVWAIPPAPQWYQWNLHSQPPQFVDLNGDGLNDLVMIGQQTNNPLGNEHKDFEYINTGSGWTQSSVWAIPIVPTGYQWNLHSQPPHFVDLNGDGLNDLVMIGQETNNPLGNGHDEFVYLNTGSGWSLETSMWDLPPAPQWHQWNLHSHPPYFTDFNGDGLTDFVIIGQETNNPLGNDYMEFKYLNTGAGWVQTSMWNFPPSPLGNETWQYPGIPPQFADFNGDGLVDLILVASYYNTISYQYLNTGNGWANPKILNIPSLPVGEESWQYPVLSPRFVDVNGDGLVDSNFIASHYYYGVVLTNYIYLNNGQKQDMLNKITYPQGGDTTIIYKPSTQYVNASGGIANKAPYTIFTVSQITNNDGVGNNSTLSYDYQGGTYFYQDYLNKQFGGYKTIAQTDGAGNIAKTYYNTSEYFKLGKPNRIEQYDNNNNLYQTTINKWESANLAGGAGFVKLAQITQESFDFSAGSGQAHKDKAESYEYDNTTGNQTQKIEWGEVVANDDGSFADTANDKRTTSITYASNQGSNNIASPSNIIVADQNNSKIKESKYYYDNLSLGSISLGNPTKEENWKTGDEYINVQKTYNNYGLITESKDANANSTLFTYDTYNLYPAVVTNALSQTTQFVYNYANGKPVQTTDANNNVFKNYYDGFGRILKTEQPDQTSPATLVAKTSYIYTDNFGAVSVQQTDYLDSIIYVDSYNYYDGLGRVVQTKKSAENNNFATKDFVYDSRGNLQKESLPYFTPLETKSLTGQAQELYISYVFDALNRKTSITNVLGSTNYVYKNWQTTITDVVGNNKDYFYDAYGNLIKVVEYNGADTYETIYSYDGAGNLIKITDALGNIRNFSYDGLGRKLSADSWNYVYDSAGNLTSLTDPKNQTINYGFDVLNRKTSEDFVGEVGVEVEFTYDTCLNGKGKLCKNVSASLTEELEYSATGNVTKDSKIIDAQSFITEYGYDVAGNQILVTNPDGSQIKNYYNLAGLLEKVEGVVNNFDYSPTGQILNITYTNGSQTTNTYDANQLYRLTNKLSTANGINLQDISYQYDLVGNITKTTDNSATDAKKIVDYTYDNLYRLISATATGTANNQDYTQSFVYDALGNILTKTNNSQTTTYTYDSANPSAVASISDGTNTASYTYDSNGNMTGEVPSNSLEKPTKNYVFDYNNRLISSVVSQKIMVKGEFDEIDPLPEIPEEIPFIEPIEDPIDNTDSRNECIPNWQCVDGACENGIISQTVQDSNNCGFDALPAYMVCNNFMQQKCGDESFCVPNWQCTDGTCENGFVTKIVQDSNNCGVDSSTADIFCAGIVQQCEPVNECVPNWQCVQGSCENGYIVKTAQDLNDCGLDPTSAQDICNATPITCGGNGDVIILPIDPPNPTITTTYAYDISGQRIKAVTNPSTGSGFSTIYPTQFYNTNGTEITKHVFANGQDIATIKGSGVEAQVYYNLTDMLNSSSVMTDSAGVVAQTLDYYPFGEIRLDTHPSTSSGSSTFNEQRKFIGQEFDAETGLNYLNARYYNSVIGRFISQDPVSLATPEKLLTDPQQLNLYSYARNNPIIGSDPTGLLNAWFPGTFTSQSDISNSTQYTSFLNDFKSTFKDSGGGDNLWMPTQTLQDNDKSRQAVAQEFVNYLSTYKFAEGETLNVGGHSHGGNEANIFSQIYDGKKIDNLVTLGTPVRYDYLPNYENIGNHYNAYSNFDLVQVSGGTLPTSAFAGAAIGAVAGSLFGPAGTALGAGVGFAAGVKLGWGEAGPAGRKYSGATNVNVTWQSGLGPIKSHTTMPNTSVWSKISKAINGK